MGRGLARRLCDSGIDLHRLGANAGSVNSADPRQHENGKIEALERFLMTAKAASKPPGSEVKVQTAVCELVEKKLKKARPNAPLQSASAPPPIPGSP